MKLYATVTSERASKGQGGNEYLYVKFMNNKQHVIARVDLKLDEDKNTFYLEIWEASGLTKHYIENPLYQAEKGNKQKGEHRHEWKPVQGETELVSWCDCGASKDSDGGIIE